MMSVLLPLLLSLMTSLILIHCPAVIADPEKCTDPTPNRDSGGSCSFQNGLCGWNNEDDDDLDWTEDVHERNTYLSINMRGVSARRDAKLISPVLCATGSVGVHSFRFRYFLDITYRCRLSVYLVSGSTTTKVWSSTQGSYNTFITEDSLSFRCPDHYFQILFLGEKLSRRSCGRGIDKIALDDVIYNDTVVIPFYASFGECPPAPTTSSTTSTTTTSTTTTRTSETASTTTSFPTRVSGSTGNTTATGGGDKLKGKEEQEEEGGLSSGAVAGIVVVVVLVVVFVVAIVVVLILRRGKSWRWRWKGSLPSAVKIRRSVTHRTNYMLGEQRHNVVLSNQHQQPHSDIIPAPPPPQPLPPPPQPTAPPLPEPPPTPHSAIHPYYLLEAPEKGSHSPHSDPVYQASPVASGEYNRPADTPEDSTQYANSGGQPKEQQESGEDRYNVLGSSGRKGDNFTSSSAGGTGGGPTYDHLAHRQGVWKPPGERRGETRGGGLATITDADYSLAKPATDKRETSDAKDRSREREYANKAKDRSRETEYANEAVDENEYANCPDRSGCSVVAPLSCEEGTSEADENSPERQEAESAGGCEYSLAQHVPEALDGGDERDDYYSCESVTQGASFDNNAQSSPHSRFNNPREITTTPSAPPAPTDNRHNGYSLAQNIKPKLSGDAKRHDDAPKSDVRDEYAQVHCPNPAVKKRGQNPAPENRPGDCVNVQGAPGQSITVGVSRAGDSYNRLDFKERRVEHPETKEDSHHSTVHRGDRYDHLHLQKGPSQEAAGEALYCNVDSDGHTP